MAVSKEDILETISNMSVMDVVDLIQCNGRKIWCFSPPQR